MRLRFQTGDLAAVALVLLLAAIIFGICLPGGQQSASRAELYLNGERIRVIPLDTDGEFTLEGAYTATVTVSGGRIAVTASDCPGEDCVHTGWISAPGRSIVCLPGRLEIRISVTDAEVDFAVG